MKQDNSTMILSIVIRQSRKCFARIIKLWVQINNCYQNNSNDTKLANNVKGRAAKNKTKKLLKVVKKYVSFRQFDLNVVTINARTSSTVAHLRW